MPSTLRSPRRGCNPEGRTFLPSFILFPLMGADLTKPQERCLDPFPVITVALGDDPPGIEKAARIRARLKGNHRVLKARLVE